MDKLVYLSECMEAIENYCRQEYNESIDRLNKIKSNRQKSKKLREVCDEARKKIEEDIELYLRIAVRAVEETSDRKHDKQNPETLTLYKIEKELKKMSEASKYQISSPRLQSSLRKIKAKSLERSVLTIQLL